MEEEDPRAASYEDEQEDILFTMPKVKDHAKIFKSIAKETKKKQSRMLEEIQNRQTVFFSIMMNKFMKTTNDEDGGVREIEEGEESLM